MVQNVQGRQSQGYASSAGKNQASRERVVNTIRNEGANQPRDKMLLAQAQEAGVVLNDEQHDFLASSLEETYDYYDDEATANAIFMAKFSPVGSINDDTIAPHYESNTLFEVPHFDTYHDDDMLNSLIQETKLNEHFVSHDDSYAELMSDSIVIYAEYMVTIQDEADHYVLPLVQNNDMILSELENIVFKVGQSAQTMHMVTKPQNFYDETYKTTLGYQNPLYLSLAQRKQPALYNGKVLIDKHNPIFVCDSEETLILAEESRLKMIEKQIMLNAKSIDYSKLNKLYEYFVPQKQLSTEQLYWSSTPSPPESVSKPTKVFPKKLPSTSQVLNNLNNAQDLLSKFDECIKRRTTLSPYQISSFAKLDIKGAFKKDVIPFSENLKETLNSLKWDLLLRLKK
nr:hypothetical protein [Tanacetum cinerariifolium]